MITLGSLSLFLSWKCNFSCAHCGFSCGPWRTEKMTLEEAKGYIDEAAGNPDLEMIAYTGGEPFLYLAELKKLMAYACEQGFCGGVVTNGYWAHDYAQTVRILACLQELGLREIITSLDDYHSEYVPTGNIANILKAAAELNIYSGLNMLVTSGSRIRKGNAAELLGLDLEARCRAKKMWVRESSPLAVGRGGQNMAAANRLTFGEKELLGNPCPFVVKNSVITPEGFLYACCGFGDASERGPASLMYAGNLKEQCFESLFTKIAQNLMFNLIYLFGPYLLLKLALEERPGLVIKGRYVSNCEICGEIAGDNELRGAVAAALAKMAPSGGASVGVGEVLQGLKIGGYI